MSGTINKVNDGGYLRFEGDAALAEQEYERFRGCLAQLLDPESMVGDVEGRWIIFKDGWVFGMAAYDSEDNARAFGRQIFREEPDASYIIVRVDAEEHAVSGLHLLASAVSDADGFDLSTTPDQRGPDDPDAP
jgi:hypothetical protein